MTVAALIEKLKEMDQDAEVIYYDGDRRTAVTDLDTGAREYSDGTSTVEDSKGLTVLLT